MSVRHLSAPDRRLLRLLPLTILWQRVPGQPERMFRELPQLHRLRAAGLIEVAYDASANAGTLLLTEAGGRVLAGRATVPAAGLALS